MNHKRFWASLIFAGVVILFIRAFVWFLVLMYETIGGGWLATGAFFIFIALAAYFDSDSPLKEFLPEEKNGTD